MYFIATLISTCAFASIVSGIRLFLSIETKQKIVIPSD